MKLKRVRRRRRRKTYDLRQEAEKWYEKSQAYRAYEIGGKALRELCERAWSHADQNNTISKLWLIGRSHSAALERRRRPKHYPTPYETTAKLLAHDRHFARLLSAASRYRGQPYAGAHIKLIRDLVSHLAAVFTTTTGMKKISLATKYLHFHVAAVPIYDSISSAALKSLVPGARVPAELRQGADAGLVYERHLGRFLAARKILAESGVDASARNLDTFLLYWWS